METSGVAGNRVLLRLRKVSATRQLKADHSHSKPPSPKYCGTCRGKTKKGLGERGNTRSDTVLCVLQTSFYRERGTCMLIYVAVSGDRNVIKKNPRRFSNIKTLQ